MLRSFTLIVAHDQDYGIGMGGVLPWKIPAEGQFFKSTTVGKNNNCIIMGRKTWESLPSKPLENRHNIVISHNKLENVECHTSLFSALKAATVFDEVFIIGGAEIYRQALSKYKYYCQKIIISIIPKSYNCDVFFPNDLIENLEKYSTSYEDKKLFTVKTLILDVEHPEKMYLNLMRKIMEKGEEVNDRTNVGVKMIFGEKMEFNLQEGFPLLTTKNMNFAAILKELLFFISGKTDTKILERQGVNIWRDNTTKDFLEKRGLPWEEGDMGPGYGFQWRNWGDKYEGADKEYCAGVDQLKNVIENIKTNPYDRRHIISAWNVSDIDKMALPPCHCLAQFNVTPDPISKNPKFLDCILYQRSADMFLGVPFNIASYSLLTIIVGNLTGLVPRKFIHMLGNAHIYKNHYEQVHKQLERIPYPFSNISLTRKLENIDDLKLEDFILQDYNAYPGIKAKMAI